MWNHEEPAAIRGDLDVLRDLLDEAEERGDRILEQAVRAVGRERQARLDQINQPRRRDQHSA